MQILALFFLVALTAAPARSVVYVAHDSAAIKDYRTNPAVVHTMVGRLAPAVTGQRVEGHIENVSQ